MVGADRPVLVYTFYLTLGHLGALVDAEPITIYHAARVVFGALLLFMAWRFLCVLELPPSSRLWAFLSIFAAQGLGWASSLPWPRGMTTNALVAWLHSRPVELGLTEAYGLQTLVQHPHLIFASALMIGLITEFHRARSLGAPPATLARVAFCGFLLGWTNPRILVNVFVIGALLCAWDRLRERRSVLPPASLLIIAALASAPPALAIWRSVQQDPLAAQWADPRSLSPSPVEFLRGFGFLWPLALFGAWKGLRERRSWAPVLVAWLFVGSLMPYLPVATQRRLVQGWGIPLSILSALALSTWIAPWLRSRGKLAVFALAPLLAAIFAFGPIYIWIGARHAAAGTIPPYILEDRARAHEWLRLNSVPEDTVLCSRFSGMFIPALAGNRVVVGHWAETINANAVEKDVARFFDSRTTAKARAELMSAWWPRYVLVSSWERRLAPRIVDLTAEPSQMKLAWNSPSVQIYEVPYRHRPR